MAQPHNSPVKAGEQLKQLDFSVLPLVYLLPTHFSNDELQEIDNLMKAHGINLTYDITEAKMIFGKVGTRRRAEHDLRVRGLSTSPYDILTTDMVQDEGQRSRKRRRLSDSNNMPRAEKATTTSEGSGEESEMKMETKPCDSTKPNANPRSRKAFTHPFLNQNLPDLVSVFKIEWFHDCLKINRFCPLKNYLVFSGTRLLKSEDALIAEPFSTERLTPQRASPTHSRISKDGPVIAQGILERAKDDAARSRRTEIPAFGHGVRRFRDQNAPGGSKKHYPPRKPKLIIEATSESEDDDGEMPDPPDWVKEGIKYACQRSTPPNPPNEAFMDQLKDIRLARTLMLDDIGVRAYSTSIAAIAAYPYAFTSPREILRIPGCDQKIANLWVEWANTKTIKEAQNLKEDTVLKVLHKFYDIWGVGAQTAREFYFDKGWQELDDIIDFGWSTLTRVQQIGVKYYQEFLTPIPRDEVERIASIIQKHATKVRGEGTEVIIVGGHRRGKKESNDVDVIVSHRDLAATSHLAHDIVNSLEEEEWITHTLLLSEHNSDRGQATLPYRAPGVGGGHGFDSLDKALVVWQDPDWPTKEDDLAENPKAKNPNIHRRVDIIISPWRTVGCAVLGWSGGTTFQRDLRRYVRHAHGWKFDSSGVRHRSNGHVVPLEGRDGAPTWQEAEKKVFEGMGLVYREPWERWTG
jgi:DNA polymerase IV